MVARLIEGSIVLIALYLVIVNAAGFSSVVRSIGSVYASSVKVLQGR